MSSHEHGLHRAHGCDCVAHRAASAHEASGSEPSRWWAVVLAALSCALCPACLATYSKLLSVAGAGVVISESAHEVMLTVAIGASVLVSAWRTIRSRRSWPLLVALSGCGLVVLGHVYAELHVLEWLGILVMLVGGLYEHFRLRRVQWAAQAS